MLDQVELKTERLLLKSVTPGLIHDFFQNRTKEETIDFFGADENEYNHLKTMHQQGIETHRISLFYFLLLDIESKRVLGDCGFHSWNKTHHRAEIFYNLKEVSDRNKGYVSEALPVIIAFGFRELNLHRIEALIADYNIPSFKLLQKFKFTKEGTMREDYVVDGVHEDSQCYSLLKHEWSVKQD